MSKIEPYFIGKIKPGAKITIDGIELFDPTGFAKHLTRLKYKSKEETKIKILAKRHYKQRSTGADGDTGNENGYLHGIVIPILADYHGYTNDETYKALELHFSRVGGTDDFPKIKPFKEYNTFEWEELMEKIRIWALTTYNVTIPSVEDFYERNISV